MTTTDTDEFLTVPEASARMGTALDALRLRVRRAESRLLEAGLIVKAGSHRLVRADRLAELRVALGLTSM